MQAIVMSVERERSYDGGGRRGNDPATDALFDFTDQVVMIIGGSRGLGRAMALGFLEPGAKVIVASRKFEARLAPAEEIAAKGGRAAPLACHVGQWDSLAPVVEQAVAVFGPIDVLINNAGISLVVTGSLDVTEALFDKVVDVNFKGVFRLTPLVASRMASGAGGSVINVGSIAGYKARGGDQPRHFQRHNLATSAIEIMSKSEARATTYVQLLTELSLVHAGVYRDTFVQTEEGWLIKERRADVDWMRGPTAERRGWPPRKKEDESERKRREVGYRPPGSASSSTSSAWPI
jgi:NAD(P)-dependent dehydrogenase (short-subunit alcohol dehydrogenase family)